MLKINPDRVRGIADELDAHAIAAMNTAKFLAEDVELDIPAAAKIGDRPTCMTATFAASTAAVSVCSEYQAALQALAESIRNAAIAADDVDRLAAEDLSEVAKGRR